MELKKYKYFNADSNLSNCIFISIITSAQEVMFSLVSARFCWLVGRLVGWFVSGVTQKLQNGFQQDLDGGWV